MGQADTSFPVRSEGSDSDIPLVNKEGIRISGAQTQQFTWDFTFS